VTDSNGEAADSGSARPLERDDDAEVVDVGIPTYNRSALLAISIASALGQTHREVQVVVSDNASSDDTAELVSRLCDIDPRLTLIRQDASQGLTKNFESVRHVGSGDYFMWLGDDDWMDPNLVSSCVGVLDEDPTVELAAGEVRYHFGETQWLEQPAVDLVEDDARERVLSYFRQVGGNGVFYGVARRSTLESVPALSNQLGGDWLHVAALAFRGRVRTVRGVELHRSVGGATSSLGNVARTLGLGPLSRHAPQLAIAWQVFADLGWRSSVYGSLAAPQRLALGARAAGIVLRRFLPGAVAKFARQRVAAVRSRRMPPLSPLRGDSC
jgi:hypothetical protein